MKPRPCIRLSIILALSATAMAGEEPSRDALYKQHQWFRLRTAIWSGPAPELYRGAVSCAFNDIRSCERHLGRVLRSAPSSERAYEAHQILEDAYLRTGRYRQARSEAEARLALKANDHDAQNDLILLRSFPDEQRVARRAHTMIDYHANNGIPLTINGRQGYYSFDTGAALSFMSESEAARLGLRIHPSEGRIGNISGRSVGFNTAVADKIAIGNFEINHVTFLVFPDERPPFKTTPMTHRGVLGIPVLTVLETICWRRDGILEVGSSPHIPSVTMPNLAFDGQTLITTAYFEGKELLFSLDTGAQETFLYQPFAKAFEALVKDAGVKDSKQITGIDQSSHADILKLPHLSIRISEFNAVLQPAVVLLTKTTHGSDALYGNIGMDLLSQPNRVTVDFKSMNLLLQ